MGRKRQRSSAQIKQTENLTHVRRTRSHSDSHRLRDALADARTNIQKVNRLAKRAQNNLKKEVRNAKKRELRALQKADSATTEAKNLRAQVTELTATMEIGRQDTAREVEVVKEKHLVTKKKLRQVREQLSRVPSRLERAVQKAVEEQERLGAPVGPGTRQIKSAAGVIEDWARDLIRNLVIKLGVPVTKAPAVFLLVAQALGVNVEDTVSDRTCRRIILEGGVFAKTQLVKEVDESVSESAIN